MKQNSTLDRRDLIARTLGAVTRLHAEMEKAASSSPLEDGRIAPTYTASARNLLHYLVLRRHDLRALQEQLAELGLSSLGRAEAHVLATLNAVLVTLHALLGQRWTPPLSEPSPLAFSEGRQLLATHTELLLGPPPAERRVHIMVTMPGEAAHDYALVCDLLQSGMDCMRINCAHGDEAEWLGIIGNLRRAQQTLAKPCKIVMDLAGPKLRTGPLQPGPAVIKVRPTRDAFGVMLAPARVWLMAEEAPQPPPAAAAACLPVAADWLARLRVGERLRCVDARNAARALRVVEADERGCWATLGKTTYFKPGTVLRRDVGGSDTDRTVAVGSLPAQEGVIHLNVGDTLLLSADPGPGRPAIYDQHGRLCQPAVIGCTPPDVLRQVRGGEAIWFDDGKIGAVIEAVESRFVRVKITRTRSGGAKLGADKGINLPDSPVQLPALTDRDRNNLRFIMRHADIVGLSFVNSPRDVEAVQQLLALSGNRGIGLILKIETRRGFHHLPEMLLTAMRGSACGVMVARGDLAVECGFERLAEVQEEILWMCEAAHIPVIWATQVLETLAKKGMPSRAEVTDAAMSIRAECVMLNKGPYVVAAVKTLDDILRRMLAHTNKKSSMLRALELAKIG